MVGSARQARSYIFVSYSRTDREFVAQLTEDLQAREINVWIDNQGLMPGTRNWEQALRDAIQGAQVILFIASPSSRRSEYVQGELAIAQMYKRPILPIWAMGDDWPDCIPIDLMRVQHIDARGDSYASALPSIIETLGGSNLAPVDLTPPETASPPDTDFVPRNPYKGLRAFRQADQQDFFGRDELVLDFTRILSQQIATSSNRLLAIIGPSGSGKSRGMWLAPKRRNSTARLAIFERKCPSFL